MALAKFVDALPLPSVIQPVEHRNGIPYFEVTMKQVKQQLQRLTANNCLGVQWNLSWSNL